MRLSLILGISAIAASCSADETISGYTDRDAVFVLTEIDGRPFPGSATISFPDEGVVRGTAPCNTWSAAQSAPYPWFVLGPVAATRRGCPGLGAEQEFFEALGAMTMIEALGSVVILSTEDGREMVFRRQD